MDFNSLLHVAQKNDKSSSNAVRYYSTKFDPPKKEEKKSTQLSANIKKFLARKEAEEKQKVREAKVRKEELLALRSQDKKATRRVSVMLKRTKSANKSVIEDAIDKDNTAVTLAGPSQPDEDDYGYVSQEASAFYNKMMAKYNSIPEEQKFASSKKNTNTNLSSTKDRVRAALLKEQEDATLPHQRKRRSRHDDDTKDSVSPEPPLDEKPQEKFKPKPRSAPPPMNFQELLKIAEKKQFEPIKIEPKKKTEDEEHPMTKKQKREYEKEKAWRENREQRRLAEERGEKVREDSRNMPPPNKIPKLSDDNRNKKIPDGGKTKSLQTSKSRPEMQKPTSKLRAELEKPRSNNPQSSSSQNRATNSSNRSISSSNPRMPEKSIKNSEIRNINRSKDIDKSRASTPSSSSSQRYPENKPKTLTSDVRQKSEQDFRKKQQSTKPTDIRSKLPPNARPKQFPPSDVRPKQFPPSDVRPKQFPPSDVRPKQFPPSDVRQKQFPPSDLRRPPSKKPPMGHKRRILDDDDSEYDSEMDDFIDDGPDGTEDYSSYIKDIFGYDKNKYRRIDDEDDAMESSFSQMMREEYISSKIGLLEDLEDMKQEAIEKERKAMMKKKMMRK